MKARRDRKGPGSQYPPQGHIPVTSPPSNRPLLLKGQPPHSSITGGSSSHWGTYKMQTMEAGKMGGQHRSSFSEKVRLKWVEEGKEEEEVEELTPETNL